jgi:hypothetical protein
MMAVEHALRTRYGRAGTRPVSHGFIVIDTRTGEILSDLSTQRRPVREALSKLVDTYGREVPQPGDVQYIGGRWYRPLGVHKVMLYPGETYSRETYRP